MLYGVGYNLEHSEENEQSILSSINGKGSKNQAAEEEASSSSRKKRPRSASKGRKQKRVRRTVHRKDQRSKVDCRRSPSPSELEESESEESETGDGEEEKGDGGEEKGDGGEETRDNEDDNEDGSPTKKNSILNIIHFPASDLKNVNVDVDGSHLIPLDFIYQKKTRPGSYGTKDQLQLVPLKSTMVIGKKKNKKTISKVIHIQKKNHYSVQQDLADINLHYVDKKMISAANDLTAKELKKEIIQNPKEFVLVELPEKYETKINNKVSKLQTDNQFKFMLIIRKNVENSHTGKFFDLF